MSDSAPWHAHIYFTPGQRAAAAALRQRMLQPGPDDAFNALCFVGDLREGKTGPHPSSQFEIHFEASDLPEIEAELEDCGLTVLVHPLTLDDLADHTNLGRWHGSPIELDLSVLDPPGINQGLERFGKSDF